MKVRMLLLLVVAASMIVGAALCGAVAKFVFDSHVPERIDRDALQAGLIAKEFYFNADISWSGDRIAAIADPVKRQAELDAFKDDFLGLKVDESSVEKLSATVFRYFSSFRSVMRVCRKCQESAADMLDFTFKILSRYPRVIAVCERMEEIEGIPKYGIVGMPRSFGMADDFRSLVRTMPELKNFDKFIDSLESETEKESWLARWNSITNCPQYVKRFDYRKFIDESSEKRRGKR